MNKKSLLLGILLSVLIVNTFTFVPVVHASEELIDSYTEHDNRRDLKDHHESDSVYFSAIGQSFDIPAGTDYNLTKASFYLDGKSGSPTGTIHLVLYAESGGVPSGSALATSDGIDITTLSAGQWFNDTFSTPYTMSAEQWYFLCFENPSEGNGTIDNSNYLRIGYKLSGSHDGNEAIYYNGGWSSTSSETSFRVYGEQEVESSPPTFGTPTRNTTVANAPCQLSVYVTEQGGSELSHYVWETNNTGTLTNRTAIAFGAGLTEAWANETWTLNSTVGVLTTNRCWANDTLGNTGVSSWRNFTTTGFNVTYIYDWRNGTLYWSNQTKIENNTVVPNCIYGTQHHVVAVPAGDFIFNKWSLTTGAGTTELSGIMYRDWTHTYYEETTVEPDFTYATGGGAGLGALNFFFGIIALVLLVVGAVSGAKWKDWI